MYHKILIKKEVNRLPFYILDGSKFISIFDTRHVVSIVFCSTLSLLKSNSNPETLVNKTLFKSILYITLLYIKNMFTIISIRHSFQRNKTIIRNNIFFLYFYFTCSCFTHTCVNFTILFASVTYSLHIAISSH